jgi:hypothetical protein
VKKKDSETTHDGTSRRDSRPKGCTPHRLKTTVPFSPGLFNLFKPGSDYESIDSITERWRGVPWW